MSADVEDRAQFAGAAIGRVADALRTAGPPDLYPSAIEIEPTEDEQTVAA
jgi:hypothetical protein